MAQFLKSRNHFTAKSKAALNALDHLPTATDRLDSIRIKVAPPWWNPLNCSKSRGKSMMPPMSKLTESSKLVMIERELAPCMMLAVEKGPTKLTWPSSSPCSLQPAMFPPSSSTKIGAGAEKLQLVPVQYANFEEAHEEAIPCHSRKGIKRESNMTHA
jgi:hypothetical protein